MPDLSNFTAISPSAARHGNSSPSTLDANGASRASETFKQLEASFASMLLKEMRQTLDEDGGLFPGDTGDVQGGLFDLYLGQHLSDAGGFGLAAALDRQYQQNQRAANVTPPTPELRPLAETLLAQLRVEQELLTEARAGVMQLYASLRKGDVAAVQAAHPRNDALADRLAAHAAARAASAARLAALVDLPPDATLQALAARVPEPFAARLLAARLALRALASQVDQFRTANANLIDRLRGFFRDVLSELTTAAAPTRYGPSGAWLSSSPAAATVVVSG